ncbi:MAG: LysR family transcriptional regulator [Proteobacteria bacterium]|nr:LysR family transcriptional regulator [Pseudomonadota bacterium]
MAPLLNHIHALTVLAERGSFTAAARHLGLSKAAMSTRVAELERALGVALVTRTTRSARLTDAGRLLVAQSAPALAQIAAAQAAAQDHVATPRGTLRLTAPVALGRQHVVPHLATFLQAHPGVRVELDLSDRLAPLAREGLDLAVRHTPQPPDDCVAWRLCATRSLLVAAPALLAARPALTHPEQLAGWPCLHYLRAGEAAVWRFAGPRRQAAQVAVSGPFAANNSEALRTAAEAGLGVALLPDFSAQAALVAGRLAPVLPGWQPSGAFGDALYALRPHASYVPLAVRLLVAHLRAALAAGFEKA